MRQRRRTIQKKPFIAYILPLLTSVLCIVLVILAVNAWVRYQGESGDNTAKDKALASFTVDASNVFIILDEKERRLSKDYTSTLYHGEGLATGASSRQYIELNGKGYGRLEEYSTFFIKQQDSSSQLINLAKGQLWLRFEKTGDDAKEFLLKTKNTQSIILPGTLVNVSSINGNQTLSVLQGKLQVKIMDDSGKQLKEILVGEGKEIALTPSMVSNGIGDDTSLMRDIGDDLKKSEWYDWNMVEDNKIANYEDAPAGTSNANMNEENRTSDQTPNTNTNKVALTPGTVDITNILAGDVFNISSITVKGDFSGSDITAISVNGISAELNAAQGTWVAYKVPLATEGKNTLTVKATIDGTTKTVTTLAVQKDATGPDTPVMTSAATVSESSTTLQGTVGKDAVRVDVNGYTLKKFVPGSGSWQYMLSTEIQNLKSGENTYKVVAYDKAGNPSKTLNAVVTYKGQTPPATNANTNKVSTGSGTTVTNP